MAKSKGSAMNITKFTYQNPDSDGDIRLEGEIVIENTADFDVELVKVSCTVLNGSGVTVGGDVTDYEDVFITPKSTEKIIVKNVLYELANALKKIYPSADIDYPDLSVKKPIIKEYKTVCLHFHFIFC